MAIIKTGSNAALPLNLVALPSAPLSASPAAAMPEGASSTPGFHLLFQGSLQAQGGRALQVENGKSLPPGGELLPDDSTDTEATLTAATSSEEGAAEGLLKTSAGDESALVDERLALALPAQREIKAASAPSSVHAESMDKTAPEALAAAAEQPRQASLTEASARAQLVAEQGHAGRATPDAVISADHAEPLTELSDHARMSAQAAERAMPSPALPADAAVAASASTQTVSATSADALAATAPTGGTATARGQADTLAAATTPAKPAVVTDAPAKPEAATILEATKVQPGEPSMAERPANAKDAGRVTPSSAMPAAMTVNGAAQDIGQQTITTGPLDVAASGQPAVDGPAAEKASQVVQSAGVMVADGTETDRTTPAPSAALAAGVADSVDVDKEALVQPAGTVTAMTDTSGVTSASRSAGVSPEVVDLAGKDVPASSLGARPDGARSTLDMPPPRVDSVAQSAQLQVQADSGESSDLGQSSRQDNQNAAFSAAVQGRGQNHAQAVASPSGQTFAQQLQQQLAEPRWGRQVGDRAIMMAQHGPRTAYIQLDPPELGAMQIRVHLQGQDQVSISFTSANPVVREALEQQMPRLREMFADQGLNLQDSSVSDEARQQGSGQRDQADSFGRQGGYGGGEGSDAEPLPVPSVAVGLVDYYA